MDILDYVRRETAYAPLKASLNAVEVLDARLRATDFYAKWQVGGARVAFASTAAVALMRTCDGVEGELTKVKLMLMPEPR